MNEYIKGNPVKTSDYIYTYQKCAITRNVSEKIIKILTKKDKTFSCICPIALTDKKGEWVNFINSKYTLAVAGWNRHARSIVKYDGNVYVLDPWKQQLTGNIIMKY